MTIVSQQVFLKEPYTQIQNLKVRELKVKKHFAMSVAWFVFADVHIYLNAFVTP